MTISKVAAEGKKKWAGADLNPDAYREHTDFQAGVAWEYLWVTEHINVSMQIFSIHQQISLP